MNTALTIARINTEPSSAKIHSPVRRWSLNPAQPSWDGEGPGVAPKTILVPLTLIEDARAPLRLARSIAMKSEAKIILLHVVQLNIAGEEYFFADLPVHALRQVGTRNGGGAQVREFFLLIVGQRDFGSDAEEFVGLDSEAGEEILLVARILICTAEPLPYHRLADAGDLADFRLIAERQRLRDGDLMMHHQPQFLPGRRRREKKSAIKRPQNA